MSITLGEAIGGSDRIIGGPFGSKLTQADYTESGIPVIRGSNMRSQGRMIQGPYAFVSESKYNKDLTRNTASPGDIIVTQRGTLGQVSIIPDHTEHTTYVVSQSQMAISVDPNVADRDFTYYYLASPEFSAYIDISTIQTGVPHINLGLLRDVEVKWPPLPEQRAIAAVLGALDDKIALNRRMNATLEGMARALFRDWFVDFGPTRAKQAGQPPYLAPGLWSLFPARLDGEGKPEGWKMGTLADLADLNPESWSRKNAPETISYVDLTNTKWGHIDKVEPYTWADAPSRARRILRAGDTVVGTVRPGNGSYAHIGEEGLTGSTGFALLRPKSARDRAFIWCAATSPQNIKRLAQLADGGAYPAVRPVAVASTKVVVPDAEVFSAFDQAISASLSLIQANERESRTLAQIRDLLLPRLMSGELRVSDVEREVMRTVHD